MKLPRPYIPLNVRLKVAERQLGRSWSIKGQSGKVRLRLMLKLLFANEPYQLDHDPALTNRKFNRRLRRYTPPANDPDYLVYRSAVGHDIKTRVRGDGAQRSDLAQRRYLKRVAANRDPKRKSRPWPKRKLRSRK
jgi:hypothetical protein